MSDDVVIRAEGLAKKYAIRHQRERYTALRDVMARGARSLWRLAADMACGRAIVIGGTVEEFWALKDVSFEVKRGDVLGVIGRNGAGKSTLLKILSRITEPSAGRVTIKGRVASLLEIGTGFHPELTGRENIYLNGAILGMTRSEIRRKFDEIIAFAEIEKFLDTPVKRYSSGMYVRLAFAVAAHLEPEILVVDEVLAVGDAEFQKKCLGKLSEVAGEGRTVLFVSHNMGAVRALCKRALLLDSGKVIVEGPVGQVITSYLTQIGMDNFQGGGQIFWDSNSAPGCEETRVRGLRLMDDTGEVRAVYEPNEPIGVEIYYEVMQPLRGARLNLHVLTQEGDAAFSLTDHDARPQPESPGIYRSTCTIPGGLLNRRAYTLELSFDLPGTCVLIPRAPYLCFSISGAGNQGSTFPEDWPGVICPKVAFRVERIPDLPCS